MFYAPPHPGPLPRFTAEREKRAVIIAARGVTLSSNFLSGRLETDAIVLHGDGRYQPCGWTALHDSALEIRDEVGFFQEVRAVLAKSIGGESGKKSPEEL